MFLGVVPSSTWDKCDYKPNLGPLVFLICNYFDSAIFGKMPIFALGEDRDVRSRDPQRNADRPFFVIAQLYD